MLVATLKATASLKIITPRSPTLADLSILTTFRKIISYLQRQPAYVNWLLKASIAALFCGYLYMEILGRKDFGEIRQTFLSQLGKPERTRWLVLLIVLMPFNWAAETRKWISLVRKVEYLSFWQAFKAVLAGVAFSLFTPNRVGEFGGRILFVRPRNALKAALSTLVGSFAQQLILIGFGFVGFVYFLVRLWTIETWILQGIIFLGALLILLLAFAFLNLNLIVPIVKKVAFLHRFKKVIRNVHIVRKYSTSELNETLLWASIRYLIYCSQYYFALKFFGIDVPVLDSAACIATVYLLQTSIPLPPLVG